MKKRKKNNPVLYWVLLAEGALIAGLCIIFTFFLIEKNTLTIFSPTFVVSSPYPEYIPTSTNTSTEAPTPSNQPDIFQPTENLLIPTISAMGAETPNTPQGLFGEIQKFNLGEAELVPPENILEEVSYYPAGGVESCPEGYFDSPVFFKLAPDVIEINWLRPIIILSCGWKENELVTLTIINPDLTTRTEILYSSKYETRGDTIFYAIYYEMLTSANTQIGDYLFRFSGQSGEYEQIYRVYLPSTPHLFSVNEGNNWYAVLYGFAPYEKVQLLNYEYLSNEKFHFMGWENYIVDQNGRLLLELYNTGPIFFAYGEFSGLIQDSRDRAIPPHDNIIKP